MREQPNPSAQTGFDAASVSIDRMIQALEHEEFVLYYQPQISVRTGKVRGAEALIRWRHPRHGLISAAQFLPALHDVRFARRVGEWAVLRARQDIERWRRAGLATVPVSINIHPEHLAMPGFVPSFLAVAEGLIDIEIIETALQRDGDVLPAVSALRAEGVRVALDDFGVGYSSFMRLAELPIDLLKVDKLFISALTRPRTEAHLLRLRRILSAVVSLAHLCHIATVAEGVETNADLAAVRELGFDQSQGYLHGQAMSADAFRRFLCQAAAPMDGTIRCPASVARAQAERPGARGVQPSVRP